MSIPDREAQSLGSPLVGPERSGGLHQGSSAAGTQTLATAPVQAWGPAQLHWRRQLPFSLALSCRGNPPLFSSEEVWYLANIEPALQHCCCG